MLSGHSEFNSKILAVFGGYPKPTVVSCTYAVFLLCLLKVQYPLMLCLHETSTTPPDTLLNMHKDRKGQMKDQLRGNSIPVGILVTPQMWVDRPA